MPPSSPADTAVRAAAGRKAVAVGKLLEAAVDADLEVMRRQGIVAWYAHSQPAFRMVGRGRFLPVAAGISDFTGMLVGGLAFCAEVKSVEGESCARSQFTDREAEQLDQAAAGGGLALAVVEFRRPAGLARAAVPWRGAPWRVRAGGAGLHLADLRPWPMMQPAFLRPFLRWCPLCGAWRLAELRPGACCLRRPA